MNKPFSTPSSLSSTEPQSRPSRGAGPYRIQVVSELTSVPSATLRAWERRYGIPVPARTTSGYRLYDDSDVEAVRQMRDLCESGVSAAEAAKAVLANGRQAPQSPVVAEGVHADPFAIVAERVVSAAVRFDTNDLDDQVRYALMLGNASLIIERTLGPALVRLGELWHDGFITVAQEHMASERITNVIRHLVDLNRSESGGERVVLACFADEDHVIGLLSAAVHIGSWGLDPILLGARTPPDAVRDAVRALKPALVALSLTIAPGPARIRELLDGYAAACEGTAWLVGGAAAKKLEKDIEDRGGMVAPSDPQALRVVVQKALRDGKRKAREQDRDA